MIETTPMQRTAFGRVLSELVEERGIPATPFRVGKLAEDAGLDGWAVINRMASTDRVAGNIDPLATALELDELERVRLAMAYAMEKEIG